MTSRNNHLTSQRGSALIVTMLLVSVLLVTALILLQRIIPYAKSVRSMHDASQAYYAARGQVDLARYFFLYGGTNNTLGGLQFPSVFGLLSQPSPTVNITEQRAKLRGNIDEGNRLIFKTPSTGQATDPKTPQIGVPFSNSREYTDHIVVSGNNQAPLQIKLFSTDSSTKNFGTSNKTGTDADKYHTLYSRNAGGLRFDLRGVDTRNIGLDNLKLLFPGNLTAIITLRMQYFNGDNSDPVKTFTKEHTISNTNTLTLNPISGDGNIQSIDTGGGIGTSVSTFYAFLNDNDCQNAKICSLSLILNPGTPSSIDFQLVAGEKKIPDLNAVVIGDGLSNNKLYYQRIIDLIPTPQDI